MNSSDFFKAHWSRHLCCKALVDRQAYIYVHLHLLEEFHQKNMKFELYYCDISPSLADPALLSVVRVVDGQFTGFITKEEVFHLHIYRAHWSRLLCFQSISRPASLKNATSDVISSQPIASFLPNNEAGHVIHRTDHEAGHVFSPTRKVVSAFSELTSTVISVPALQTRPCCR